MEKLKVAEVGSRIVDILEAFSPEERRRAVGASLTLLGDELVTPRQTGDTQGHHESEKSDNFPARSQVWMKQNGISTDEIHQVFHFADGTVEVIASEVPGKNDKERTYVAYVLTGIANFLATGSPAFDDKTARALCKSSGCFNLANHSAYLSDKGNEFAGSKEKGWALTAPGLKRGAELVKQLNRKEK